jgi:serine/threonine-protein kinase
VSTEPSAEPKAEAGDLIGRTIGSYRVTSLLGKGGMGAVYLGVHPVIGSKVAIKFLHPQYKADARIVDRFYNEARAVNLIGHDNILKILDLSVTDDGLHYFVMELLDGGSLQDLLAGGRPVGLEIAGPILLQVCDALEAAHKKGIVHRDLKPDNVHLIALRGKKNFVKLVDFGIARVTDDDGVSRGNTVTGMVMGTPSYMSPEQGSGARQIDGRSDVYSLGVMMFQLATGQLPFRGENFGEMLIGHLQDTVPPLRELNPEVPELYERVVMRCLEKEPGDRYQTMRELKGAVAFCLDQLGVDPGLPLADASPVEETSRDTIPERTPPRQPSNPALKSNPGARARPRAVEPSTQIAPPPRKRRRGLVAAALGGAVVAASVAVVLLLNAHEERQSAQATAAALAAKAAEEAKPTDDARPKATPAEQPAAEPSPAQPAAAAQPVPAAAPEPQQPAPVRADPPHPADRPKHRAKPLKNDRDGLIDLDAR